MLLELQLTVLISASVSEAVEKITTAEKDYRKCSLCVLLCTATAVTKSRPTYS